MKFKNIPSVREVKHKELPTLNIFDNNDYSISDSLRYLLVEQLSKYNKHNLSIDDNVIHHVIQGYYGYRTGDSIKDKTTDNHKSGWAFEVLNGLFVEHSINENGEITFSSTELYNDFCRYLDDNIGVNYDDDSNLVSIKVSDSNSSDLTDKERKQLLSILLSTFIDPYDLDELCIDISMNMIKSLVNKGYLSLNENILSLNQKSFSI